MRRLGRRQGGFTLLEVMISLAILAIALVLLLEISTRHVRSAHEVKMMTIATELARGKMLDIEEDLLHEGFQEMAETLEGDFDEEGYPKLTWDALIEKVELPEAGEMAAEAQQPGAQGEGESPLMGFLPGGGGKPGDAMAAAGTGQVLALFPLFKPVLEQAIRKVTLTVKWKIGAQDEKMVVVCYFTDPKAVDSAFGALSGLSGGGTGAGGTGAGGTGAGGTGGNTLGGTGGRGGTGGGGK